MEYAEDAGQAAQDIAEKRRALRKEMLSARDRMDAGTITIKSHAITQHLWALPQVRQARVIFTYAHFRSEPETMELMALSLGAGKRVAVPLTDSQGKRLVPYFITSPATELQPGFCSIPEPDPEKAVRVAPREIDLVVLPGSVFDESGNRLGYGGGYYDRFLAGEARGAFRVAIGFEMQVVPELAAAPHDIPVDILVTELKVRVFQGTRT